MLLTRKMEPIVLLSFHLFIENGYVQHSGAKYLGYRNLRYCVFFVADDIKLLNAIQFGHGACQPISKLAE